MGERDTDAEGTPPDTSKNDWEAVFWDIGGVILDLESVARAHRRFIDALLERHDLEYDPETALEAWRRHVGEAFRERESHTYYPAREAYARGTEAILDRDRPLEAEDWRPLFERVTQATIEPNPGAIPTIEALAERPLHVGIISDVDNDECRAILETFDIVEAFDSITTSEAVGYTKPHPAMFETALEAAGVRPKRALMIGDRYEHDIAGGADAGLVPVSYGADPGPKTAYECETLFEILQILDSNTDSHHN